ncbi:MAG: hypothetical protein M3276_03995 [Actinomycetota bacterium]|nr:hypothetical protein [Actinomycetota bacterium]
MEAVMHFRKDLLAMLFVGLLALSAAACQSGGGSKGGTEKEKAGRIDIEIESEVEPGRGPATRIEQDIEIETEIRPAESE